VAVGIPTFTLIESVSVLSAIVRDAVILATPGARPFNTPPYTCATAESLLTYVA
jgi:hypothetical protein